MSITDNSLYNNDCKDEINNLNNDNNDFISYNNNQYNTTIIIIIMLGNVLEIQI